MKTSNQRWKTQLHRACQLPVERPVYPIARMAGPHAMPAPHLDAGARSRRGVLSSHPGVASGGSGLDGMVREKSLGDSGTQQSTPSLLPYNPAGSGVPPSVFSEVGRQAGLCLIAASGAMTRIATDFPTILSLTADNKKFIEAFKAYGTPIWGMLALAAYSVLSFIPGLNGPSQEEQIRQELSTGAQRVAAFYSTFGFLDAMNRLGNDYYRHGLALAIAEEQANAGKIPHSVVDSCMVGWRNTVNNIKVYMMLCQDGKNPETFKSMTRQFATHLQDKELAIAGDPKKAAWDIVEEMQSSHNDAWTFFRDIGKMDAEKAPSAFMVCQGAEALGLSIDIMVARCRAAEWLYYASFADNTEVLPDLWVGRRPKGGYARPPDQWNKPTWFTVKGHNGLTDFRRYPGSSKAGVAADFASRYDSTKIYVDDDWAGALYKKFYPEAAAAGFEGDSLNGEDALLGDTIYHGSGSWVV